MLALRYLYVLAVSIWFGGIIMIDAILAPVSGLALHRFYLTSYAAGALALASLSGMALLGPRPSGFFARLGVALGMFALTLLAGLGLRTRSIDPLALAAVGGLALLFWEARDGTRAA